MMKITAKLAFFLFLILSGRIIDAQQVMVEHNLSVFGPVKTISLTAFAVKKENGKWVAAEIHYRDERSYNRDKSRIEQDTYPGGTDSTGKEVYSFDGEKLVKREWSDSDGKRTKTIAYEYDKEGRLIKVIDERTDPLNFAETYSYPDKNYMIIRRRIGNFGTFSDHYAYDDKRNVTQILFYDPKGHLSYKELYQYDGKGNPTAYFQYDPKGLLQRKETYQYEYDKQGNWIKMLKSEYSLEKKKLKLEPREIVTREIVYY